MTRPPQIFIAWDNQAKADLKLIYAFNKKVFSEDFARKVLEEVLNAVSGIVFSEQWAYDSVIGKPYRRILIRHYKVLYLPQSKTSIYILRIFDVRTDPKSQTL